MTVNFVALQNYNRTKAGGTQRENEALMIVSAFPCQRALGFSHERLSGHLQ